MHEQGSSRFINRELSWLAFNQRVLSEAGEPSLPLMERLKFLGIAATNLDEFFMVRIGGLSQGDGAYGEVYHQAFLQMQQINERFMNHLVPDLAAKKIRRLLPPELSKDQFQILKHLFHEEVQPLLTPIAIHPDRTLPLFDNLGTYHLYQLNQPKKDPSLRHYAVVEVPFRFRRMLTLESSEGFVFLLMEDLLEMFAPSLFQGFEIQDQAVFRITRAADMTLDEEKDEDFAKVMSKALRQRRRNYVVRLEFQGGSGLKSYLQRLFNIPEQKIFDNDGWFDLASIAKLAAQQGFEDLKNKPWIPRPVSGMEDPGTVWDTLKGGPLLVHHPYESFDAFCRFLDAAADDPDVLAIKQTLYRVGSGSSVLAALERAAVKRKQVTVLVELKARFDEERNIEWARRLEDAGATVIYGVAGFKTHCKACLVIRREPSGILRYVHLSTGNYNEITARLYTDLSYFTTEENLTRDIAALFNTITGLSQPVGFTRISMAPYGLRSRFQRLISREIMRHSAERPGLIMAKMNSLVDVGIIEDLYRASKAGVRILLNVRGVCCLRPGPGGPGENIQVVSIIDRFLEHSRIFYFQNAGEDEIYLSSADWMPRNLDRRIELLFPVEAPAPKKNLIRLLEMYFQDNTQSFQLQNDGSYVKREPGKEKRFRVQEVLCRKALEREKVSEGMGQKTLRPQKPK